jgi:hypothetical protein
MSHPNRPEGEGPTPQLLAAYVDGELGPADRTAVEAWLRDHPEARATVESQRRLLRLWQAATPADPGPAAWDAILARVEKAAAGLPAAPAGGRRLAGALRLTAGLGAVAAALLLAVALSNPFRPRTAAPAVQPLPVATSTDVEILSIEGDDVGALVVGEPPVQGSMTLASSNDVTVDHTGRDVQIVRPTPEHYRPAGRRHEDSPPMFMVPTDPSQGKAP